jgi:hypothetical protein
MATRVDTTPSATADMAITGASTTAHIIIRINDAASVFFNLTFRLLVAFKVRPNASFGRDKYIFPIGRRRLLRLTRVKKSLQHF